jgi:uncharacterized membrane protein YgcG
VLALLLLLSLPPENINPPVSGHYVRDLTGQISTSTLSELDGIARGVKASGYGQLGVAIVNTTNGVPPRAFATRLFNHWGIGHAGTDDGLLLFVALDDHKAEIIIGKGLLDTRVSTSQTDAVMADVVQRFKAHDLDGAVVTGARQLADLLNPKDVESNVYMPDAPTGPPTSNKVIHALEGVFTDPSPRGWVIDLTDGEHSYPELDRAGDGAYAKGKRRLFFLVTTDARLDVLAAAVAQKLGANGTVVVAFDPNGLGAAATGPRLDNHNAGFQRAVEKFRADVQSSSWEQAGIDASTLVDFSVHGMPHRSADEAVHDVVQGCGATLLAWPFVFLFGGVFGFRRWNRYRPRTCECGRPRQLLSAYAEKTHLTPSQQAEEDLGSVDYDVWWCALCKNVWINDNVAWFSRYSRCPSCDARTRSSSTTTISYATEYSTGLEEITETCQGCNYRNVYTRTTAMLTRSSSSSWDSGGSSSSDSFGGGSSGGDGSSGSW